MKLFYKTLVVLQTFCHTSSITKLFHQESLPPRIFPNFQHHSRRTDIRNILRRQKNEKKEVLPTKRQDDGVDPALATLITVSVLSFSTVNKGQQKNFIGNQNQTYIN